MNILHLFFSFFNSKLRIFAIFYHLNRNFIKILFILVNFYTFTHIRTNKGIGKIDAEWTNRAKVVCLYYEGSVCS